MEYRYVVKIILSCKEDVDLSQILDAAHQTGSLFEDLLGVEVCIDDTYSSAEPLPSGI